MLRYGFSLSSYSPRYIISKQHVFVHSVLCKCTFDSYHATAVGHPCVLCMYIYTLQPIYYMLQPCATDVYMFRCYIMATYSQGDASYTLVYKCGHVKEKRSCYQRQKYEPILEIGSSSDCNVAAKRRSTRRDPAVARNVPPVCLRAPVLHHITTLEHAKHMTPLMTQSHHDRLSGCPLPPRLDILKLDRLR
jgi:hypothetical protein